jgi:hypothetical protein
VAGIGNTAWKAAVIGDFAETDAKEFLMQHCALPEETAVSDGDWKQIYEVGFH